jgi:hypothetical protein
MILPHKVHLIYGTIVPVIYANRFDQPIFAIGRTGYTGQGYSSTRLLPGSFDL